MKEMPSSAVSSWADFAAVEPGAGQFLTLVLLFVQLMGLIAIGNGAMKIIYFVTPGHQKAPATVGGPIIQIIFGLFALVPGRVYNFALDVASQMGWM